MVSSAAAPVMEVEAQEAQDQVSDTDTGSEE